MPSPDFITGIRDTAGRLGMDPVDLLTIISFETGSRMSPSMWGGRNNNHLGLIQFGPAERAKYGAHPAQTDVEQLRAVEAYFRDRGYKPGMGLLDAYSTVNAGRPGLYHRSDAANGGTWGTVADKVNHQMAAHRLKAQALLNGQMPATGAAGPVASAAPLSMAPGAETATPAAAADDGTAQLIQSLAAISQQQDEGLKPLQTLRIDYPTPPGLRKARALARETGGRV